MAAETSGSREDRNDGNCKQKPMPIDLDDGNHKQKRVHDDMKDPDASSSDKLLDERRVLKGSCSRCGLVHCDYMVTAWIYGLDEFDCNILLPGIDDSDHNQMPTLADLDNGDHNQKPALTNLNDGNRKQKPTLIGILDDSDHNQKPALADLDDGDHKQKPMPIDLDGGNHKQKRMHDTDGTLLAGLDDTDDTDARENDDMKLLDERRVSKGSCCRCGIVHCDYMVTAWIYGLDEFDCNILLPGIDDSDDKQSYMDVDSLAGNSYVPESLADVDYSTGSITFAIADSN